MPGPPVGLCSIPEVYQTVSEVSGSSEDSGSVSATADHGTRSKGSRGIESNHQSRGHRPNHQQTEGTDSIDIKATTTAIQSI